MGARKAKICEYPIAHELGDETVIAHDRARLGLAHRHCVRRRVDVVAVRHAAGACRARQRSEKPLRGCRDRPRLGMAAVLVDQHSLTFAASCCWRCCSGRLSPSWALPQPPHIDTVCNLKIKWYRDNSCRPKPANHREGLCGLYV